MNNLITAKFELISMFNIRIVGNLFYILLINE